MSTTPTVVIPVLMVDDSKDHRSFTPLPNVVVTDYRQASRLMRVAEVDTLYLDYYLDERFTGSDFLQRLLYRRERLPKRIVFISTDEECNDKMLRQCSTVYQQITAVILRDHPHDIKPITVELITPQGADNE